MIENFLPSRVHSKCTSQIFVSEVAHSNVLKHLCAHFKMTKVCCAAEVKTPEVPT